MALVRSDPQLGLAKVRIEIERVLRSIYEQSVVNPRRQLSLGRMLDAVRRQIPLPGDLASTIADVIGIARIEPSTASL